MAVGWSGYVAGLLRFFGITLPFDPTPKGHLALFGFSIPVQCDLSLDLPAWIGFGSWLATGLAIYFLYSRRHSAVQRAFAEAAARANAG